MGSGTSSHHPDEDQRPDMKIAHNLSESMSLPWNNLVKTALGASAPLRAPWGAFQRMSALLVKYGIALTLLVILLQRGLDPFMGEVPTFLLLTIGVTISAWFGGLIAGLVATSIGAVGIAYIFTPSSSDLDITSTRTFVHVCVFVLVGSFISLLSEARKRADSARIESVVLLNMLLNLAPVGFAFVDRHLRFLRVNSRMAEINGFPVAAHAGRTGAELMPELDAAITPLLQRVLETGEAILDVEISGETPAAPGETRYWLTSHYPVRLPGGPVLGVGSVVTDITERKRMEQALLRANERLNLAIEALDGYIYEYNPLTRNVERGSGLSRVVGYHPEEVPPIAEWWAEQMHPEDRAKSIEEGDLALEEDERYALEYRVRHKDGHYVYVWDRAIIVREADGHGMRTVGTTINITERKQLEQALRESEMRYRRIVTTASEGIWVLDLAGHTTFVNQRMAEMLGYTEAEMLEQTPLEVVFEEERAGVERTFVERPSGTTMEQEDVRLCRKDGTVLWTHVSTNPIFDDDGGFLGMLAMFTDITERKRAEEARTLLAETGKLLASSLDYETTLEQLLRIALPTFADQCTVDLLQVDGSLRRRIVFANPDLEPIGQSLESYPPVPHLSHPIWQVLQSGQTELIADIPHQMVDSVMQNDEHRALIQSVTPRSAIIAPLIARGRTLGTLMFTLNSSLRRYNPSDLELAEELARRAAMALDNARLYREAQEAVRMRDQFFSVAVHELKTPLTAMLGQANLVERRATQQGMLTERDLRGLRTIAMQTRRLDSMIGALLDVSRIARGQLAVERQPLDLGNLVRRVVEEMQPGLERHSVVCTIADETLLVHGDEVRLEQVLQNLLSNAIKYSPNGGVVSVHVLQRDTNACVAITDEGIGIPTEVIPNLFQRFYRVDNADTKHISGMGIGLHVVKEIVTLHGGSVEVESSVGGGSTFSVCLPLQEEHDK